MGQEPTSGEHHTGDGGRYRQTPEPGGKIGKGTVRRGSADSLHRHEGKDGEHGDDGDVLEKEGGEGVTSAGGPVQALFAEALKHDGGGTERQDEAGDEGLAEIESGQEGCESKGEATQQDLGTADAEECSAHPPQGGQAQFESDQEEHHHDTGFGDVKDVLLLIAATDPAEGMGPDADAGDEVAEHGA